MANGSRVVALRTAHSLVHSVILVVCMAKVVLAYSGGLDTSVAIRWINEKYDLDVVAVTVDVGNEKDFEVVRQKALRTGAVQAFISDAKESFVRDFVIPSLPA